jgi:FkbM family methyltransferase
MTTPILPGASPPEIFQVKKLPDNVRCQRWLAASFLTRLCWFVPDRLGRWAFGCRSLKAEGAFIYHGREGAKEVIFNGRNAQFHALYEDCYRHGYEFETAVLMRRLAPGAQVFYDIGANWGYFSLLFAAWPEFGGSVFAFEPNPTSFADLKQTIEQAGVGGRVTALNYGLGRVEETLRIDQKERFWTGAARLSAQGSGASVPVHTLDNCQLPPPGLIKVDAEGMETAIFMGGEKMLQTHKPWLIFENYLNFDDPDQTWAPLTFLAKLGYRLFNPALGFRRGDRLVPLSYGDPVEKMLRHDARPATCLVEITPANRFLMRPQLNVFACHESRLGELTPPDFIHLPL